MRLLFPAFLIGSLMQIGVLCSQTPCFQSSAEVAMVPDQKGILMSVDGQHKMTVSPAWTSGRALHGPWNLDECGDGFDNYNESNFTLYWNVFPGAKLEAVVRMAKNHLLPRWLNLPTWDPGKMSRINIAGCHIVRLARSNGIPFEEVDIIAVGNGVAVCHFLGYPHPTPPRDFNPSLDEIVRALKSNPNLTSGTREKMMWKSQPYKVPQTMREGFAFLDNRMSDTDRNALKNESEDVVFEWDEGVGARNHPAWIPWIQRYWGLNDGGSPLSKYLIKNNLVEPSEQGYAILIAYRKHLLGQKIDIKRISLSVLSNRKDQKDLDIQKVN